MISTIVGYTGGSVPNPGYKAVSRGGTGHAEVVRVRFDSTKVSYEKLLKVFWRNIDPTVKNRQFCDVGSQYRSAIFYHNNEQRTLAESSREDLKVSGKITAPIYTEIVAAAEFYPAEDYHQDYYRKNPANYKRYRKGCGRDRRLNEIWGDMKQESSQN